MTKKLITFVALFIVLYPISFGLVTVIISNFISGWSVVHFWSDFTFGAKLGIRIGIPTMVVLVPTVLWLKEVLRKDRAKNEHNNNTPK